MNRLSVRKYRGDSLYDWAVFLDGQPIYTGCSKREAQSLANEYRARHGIK